MTEQDAIAAISDGHPVDCTPDQWPEIRYALQVQAAKWIDTDQVERAQIALQEVRILDQTFADPRKGKS